MLWREALQPVVALGLRLVIAAVWIAAAVGKLRAPRQARDTMHAMLHGPRWLIAGTAVMLPAIELMLGVLLLGAMQLRPAAAASALLFLFFALLLGGVAIRDSVAQDGSGGCGCFGVPRTVRSTTDAPAVVGSAPRAIGRNLLLAAAAMLVAMRG
jgi:uncharacterized membrane protein YphA (DoxX/SURF4 family)